MSGHILSTLRKRELEVGPFADTTRERARWSHWQLARDANGIAWLMFDQQGRSVNVLAEDVLEELGEVLLNLREDKPKGLVLRSGKRTNFCVGADIREFRRLGSTSEIVDKLKAAHAIADQLAGLPCPTIAVIHGMCLGGGLELALCCDYRLGVPGATLGLPEVRLGLHPGLGGTARLTHLVDPIDAMKMMLTGKLMDVRKAKAMGLVDQVIAERHVANAVLAAVGGEIERSKAGIKARLLRLDLARQRAADQMRSKSAAKAPPEHYPAPNALINLWEKHGGNSHEMLSAEIESFARLLASDTAQNLIRVFFLRERMKALTDVAETVEPVGEIGPVQHVHVIGAGKMGGDIASWCALQGLRVSLFDTQPKMIAKAIQRAAALGDKKHLDSAQHRDFMDRLIPDIANAGVRQADLVIEAAPEKIDLKRQIFRDIEPQMKSSAILATNTSSIPLEQLSEALQRPERLVGLHFFNPVAKMQLVEVVGHAAVDETFLARARAFVGAIDRLPAPVSSAPGFLVNRVLMPYLAEAIQMLDEGISAEAIDGVAEAFGMPVGPIELADEVGLDICLGVFGMLRERLDAPFPEIPAWFKDKVGNEELGRKTGYGFYHWDADGPRKKSDPEAAPADTLDRLLLPMLNACMACLQEGVIEDEDLLDGALVFGTGFAPFRGGPMHYARQRGFADIVHSLTQLTQQYGERFAADPGWHERH